jgi:hypothetical protein
MVRTNRISFEDKTLEEEFDKGATELGHVRTMTDGFKRTNATLIQLFRQLDSLLHVPLSFTVAGENVSCK